jgi:hypothetical protein
MIDAVKNMLLSKQRGKAAFKVGRCACADR